MGKYIGETIPAGIFHRQQLFVTILPSGNFQDTYTLSQRIANESSILVVCDRILLRPIDDYIIVRDGTLQKIKLNVDFSELASNHETFTDIQLHVLYLGKELLNSSLPTIDSVGDVVIDGAVSGQVLKFDGQNWINSDVVADSGFLATRIAALEGLAPSLALKTYVDDKVSDLINGAPGALDTLNELALALGNDENFSATIINTLASKANISSLALVATSGSYNDLINKPTLATVATSGSYNDLSNKPTLASFASISSPISGQVLKYNGTAWANSTLSTVATSGSYNDLSDTPSLFSGAYADLTGTPALATVATSGSYNDLSHTPTIPSTIAALTGDVTITNPESGNVLKYNGTKWVNQTPVTVDPVTTLDALDDVQLTFPGPTTGQVLQYNGSTWVNTDASGVPSGSVIDYAGATAPTGWALCDGSSLNTYTYKTLHAVISNTYGGTAYAAGTTDQPSAVTTFKVPDLRRRVTVGSGASGDAIGDNDGIATAASRSLTHSHDSTMPAHYHDIGTGAALTAAGQTHTGNSSTTTIGSGGSGHGHGHSLTADNGGAHIHNVNGRSNSTGFGSTGYFTRGNNSGSAADIPTGFDDSTGQTTNEGAHSHGVSGTVGGSDGTHSHTGVTINIDHTHASSSVTGTIGLVTGGANGNIAQTLTSNSINNTNYMILNKIIKL